MLKGWFGLLKKMGRFKGKNLQSDAIYHNREVLIVLISRPLKSFSHFTCTQNKKQTFLLAVFHFEREWTFCTDKKTDPLNEWIKVFQNINKSLLPISSYV